MMCLALCNVFDVIFIRLVAYLAKSMIFVWNWLRLRNRNDAKVVISLNMTLFVFGCLFCPKFFDSRKIVYRIFLFRSCCARAIPIRNITLKSVIVIGLLENASSQVGWIEKLSSHETSNWRCFDVLSFILGLCHCNLDSTFNRAYSRSCSTRGLNLPSFIINCQLIQLVKNLSCAEIIDP